MSPLPPAPFVYPILDAAALGGRRVDEVAAALVAGGARIVQFRAKGVADATFVELARQALTAVRAGGALLIVNDRPDVARLLDADGVHVGQDDLPPLECRRLLGAQALIGWSTHRLDQMTQPQAAAASYLAVGPIFATRSKADAEPVIGLEGLRRARSTTALPLVAIGGITQAKAGDVAAAGADGLAVIAEVMGAPDTAEAVRALRRALGESA